MQKIIHKKSQNFEENYFKGYYKGAVGGFTKKDLEISRNWFSAWFEVINSVFPVRKGNNRKVLEIGCSIGGLSSLFAERGFKVRATDISGHAIKNAAKLNSNVKFSVLDVRKKISLKEKFDLIIAIEVVEHLESPEIALKNLYEVLNPGGTIIISSPYPYLWNMNDPTHINVRFPHEWINLLRQTGFQNIKYKRFSLLPFFYRFHRRMHVIFPFHIPFPYLNNPILFIGEKA